MVAVGGGVAFLPTATTLPPFRGEVVAVAEILSFEVAVEVVAVGVSAGSPVGSHADA